MEPTTLFPIIGVLSLIGVEYGGWALLGFLTQRERPLTAFQLGFFRAGHAHAGVLLVLSLVYYLYLPRAEYSEGVEWIAGIVLVAGIIGQSSGFFLHAFLGSEDGKSPGTTVTRAGAVLIATALIILAVGLIRTA